MTGPWARLIGFGSRGYWICEKLQTAFPTPEPGHSFKEKGLRSLGPGKKAGSQVPPADDCFLMAKTFLCLEGGELLQGTSWAQASSTNPVCLSVSHTQTRGGTLCSSLWHTLVVEVTSLSPPLESSSDHLVIVLVPGAGPDLGF